MTEEDTFLKLKQIPYNELSELWFDVEMYFPIHYSSLEPFTYIHKIKTIEFLEEYGWTFTEFIECTAVKYIDKGYRSVIVDSWKNDNLKIWNSIQE